MRILELKSGGPVIKKVLEKVLEIQIQNPKITKEDLIDMLTKNKDSFLN